jgi:V/A-type H+/Na+-transporting ATPase subunit F
MRLFVLGDEEAVLGFSLTGVRGRVAKTPEEVQDGLNQVLDDTSIGILLITADAANMIRSEVDRLKIAAELPLILEIPSSTGTFAEISIRHFISEAIGVSL